MKHFLAFLCLVCLSCAAIAQEEYDPLNAVVRVDTTFQQPDYFIPWQDKMQDASIGSGVVIDGNRILTNAHNVANATYITVKKQSGDDSYHASVLAVDYGCDLALLQVDDEAFFADIVPFELGETPPAQTQVAVVGFPVGGEELSVTLGIISRIELQTYHTSLYNLLAAQLDAAVNPGNSGGPVLYDGKIVGIVFQYRKNSNNIGYMIPTEIIRHFLTDIADGRVDGFGTIGVTIAGMENPDTRRFFKMQPGQTGIRVIGVDGPNAEGIRRDDVLLALDGVKIANNGNIRLATGEPRSFRTLISRKQIGEKVRLTILRDGEQLEVQVPVRNFDFRCKQFLYDTLPDYYIVGGFVFTTLSYSFLDEYTQDPPAELAELMFAEKQAPDDEIVVCSFVLADQVNLGAQGLSAEVLTSVNGQPVRNLREFIAMVEGSDEEFITWCFGKDDYPVTLDLRKLRATTPAILERYRVPADRSASLR